MANPQNVVVTRLIPTPALNGFTICIFFYFLLGETSLKKPGTNLDAA
jgi:hypothetical protein